MRSLLIVLGILMFAAGVASARQEAYAPRDIPEQGRSTVFWFDDLEPVDPGWAHGDHTATYFPWFHVSAYLSYSGQYSWWCGTFDYDADGGYGNNWDDRLDCPATDWTGYLYPIVTFAYRNDSEPGYDYSYVDASSSGVWVHLNRGFDGVHPWGTTGYYLGNKANPVEVRFRFVSDGAWSDQDGDYQSYGGAFACDEIMISDYYTGTVLFYDGVESGGICIPSGPPAAGDYWHIIENGCKSWSPPHVWVNTQPDTNDAFVPPGVQNWLRTPYVDISSAVTCTTYFVLQFYVPTVYGDYWTEEVTTDGGASWTLLHSWWGDQCDMGYYPCDHFLGGDDITALLPGTGVVAHRWTYYNTTGTGAGPDICGCAGITIDDAAFYGAEAVAVEETSWGKVKALYR